MSPTNVQNGVAPGFTPLDEAVAIIKSDTRQHPVVDMDYIITRIKWIEAQSNFRIPKVRRLAPEEMYRTPRGKIVEYEKDGEINVQINTNFEKELLRKTILDKYRELVGKEYQEIVTRGRSTVADDAQGRDAVRPRNNTPNTKAGDTIGGDNGVTSTNGDSLSV